MDGSMGIKGKGRRRERDDEADAEAEWAMNGRPLAEE